MNNTELNFDQDYILENEFVKLEPLRDEHLDILCLFAMNEPTLWRYSLLPADGIENMTAYLAAALEGRKERTSYPFIVYDKRKAKFAGSTRFYDYQKRHRTVQLGYTWYGQQFQGSGINKNCKFLMLEFAFDVLKLERVEFRADNNNKRSIAAMKSIGCVSEGVLRSNCVSQTGRRDSIILSILMEEWFSSVKMNLKNKVRFENERFRRI